MAKPILRAARRARPLSPRSTAAPQQSVTVDGDDSFSDLSRRLLVTVSQIKLVSQHFGDLSGLSLEDSYAGMTLHEAANDLDALYSELAGWHVQHEHRPKAPEASSEPEAPEETGGTEGQRLYEDVQDSERQLKSLMDEIPYSILDRDPQTCQWLEDADTHLQDVVTALQKVRDREAPRYNRSAAANTP